MSLLLICPLGQRTNQSVAVLNLLLLFVVTYFYALRLLQVRCETQPEILLHRYRERIESGERHAGHVDQSEDRQFHELIRKGPLDWVHVQSERLSVDTSHLRITDYASVAAEIKELIIAKETNERLPSCATRFHRPTMGNL